MRKRLLTMVSMAFALAALMAWAVPQEWSVDVSRVQPYQFNAYHGETMELKASFFLRGQPYDVGGADFALFWQTNGMGSAYWTAPATAASNTVSAVFTGAMDPGAPLVYGFLGSTGSNYRASFAIRFAASPGAVPNELPLPVPTIDFSKVDAINAPWATTNALDDATNSLTIALDEAVTNLELQIAANAAAATNYTDSAQSALEASMALAAQAATNYTDAAALEINGNLSTNYYTAAETDDAIDALAAYYITSNSAGDAFPSYAALTNATVYYSGGEIRTPTRNDYAIVLADETHSGAEWRYIYAVHSAGDPGQWEAQYPIETNDYEGLSNKPQINGVTLLGSQTLADFGILGNSGNQTLEGVLASQGQAITIPSDSNREANMSKIGLVPFGTLRKGQGKLGYILSLKDGTDRECSLYIDDDGKVYINTPSGYVEVPNATAGDTLALVSQLANYLPLTGGDLSGAITVHSAGNARRISIDGDKFTYDIDDLGSFELYLPRTNSTLAPLASPAFTGTPTAPNMDAQSPYGQVANKKYVDDKVAGVSVTPLSGQTFDFATMQGIFAGVKACIEALGGSVTNFPAIPANE